MDIEFTHHTIHSFEVHSSMVCSVLTELCSHQYNRPEKIFITSPQKFITISSITPSPKQPIIYFLLLWICLF